MIRISQAIILATQAHEGQVRKASKEPYIWHPLAVGQILQSLNCEENTVISGILHDTVEDTPVTLTQIEETFGLEVRTIVAGCTEDKTLPWEARKRHTIEKLAHCDLAVAEVTAADKIDNLRSLAKAFEKQGEALWTHFRRDAKSQKWYFDHLLQSLKINPVIKDHPIVTLFEEAYQRIFPLGNQA